MIAPKTIKQYDNSDEAFLKCISVLFTIDDLNKLICH